MSKGQEIILSNKEGKQSKPFLTVTGMRDEEGRPVAQVSVDPTQAKELSAAAVKTGCAVGAAGFGVGAAFLGVSLGLTIFNERQTAAQRQAFDLSREIRTEAIRRLREDGPLDQRIPEPTEAQISAKVQEVLAGMGQVQAPTCSIL
ncbi:MAG: hypothetical protein K2Q33_05200 [Gammaproteobacteria bacterium]|nr:hypothetical protein [Gammaproteobacteria bacterium]